MKVLITGGAGFIGSHLADELIKKNNIKKILIIDDFKDGTKKNISHLFKSKKIIIVKKDINKIKINDIDFKNCKYIFHLAAVADIVPSIINPIEYCETNIMGTIKVLEAMRHNNINKIIYAASSSCYGIPKKYPTSENEKINTQYPYAFSKNIGEQAIIHWSKVYGIKYGVNEYAAQAASSFRVGNKYFGVERSSGDSIITFSFHYTASSEL